MIHHTIRSHLPARLAAAGAALISLAMAAAPAVASADTTTFQGKYVCGDGQPVAGAPVQLYDYQPPSSNSFFGLDESGYVLGAPQTTTDKNGNWSFTVPAGDPQQNYSPILTLDDGHVTVDDFPASYPFTYNSGENQNDTALQDYGTQVVSAPECDLWVGLKRAYDEYFTSVGIPPAWSVTALYGAPGKEPTAGDTTINWPARYPVNTDIYFDTSKGAGRLDDVNALRLFGHTIRNASLSPDTDKAVRLGGVAFRGARPCMRTDAGTAWAYGWAEFWAGQFRPAPYCPGISRTDLNVEGNVAAALWQRSRHCPNATRSKMVHTLFRFGARIHTVGDFFADLGACAAGPFDPTGVSNTAISRPIAAHQWVAGLKAKLGSTRGRASELAGELPSAIRGARLARCSHPPSPCFAAIVRTMRPTLLSGQLAQARLDATTLSALISPRAQRNALRPTASYLLGLDQAVRRLGRGLGAIGVRSIDAAFHDARKLIPRDHTSLATRFLDILRVDRAAFARARRSGSGLPLGYPIGGLLARPHRGHTISRSHHLVSFNGIPDGTVITTQTAAMGASFGGAQSLGFPGTPGYPTGSYLCDGGPTVQAGVAVTPACPRPGSFDFPVSRTGTMARLTSSAQSVSVTVGATVDTPGGAAAYVYGYDAAGKLVSQNSALVGAANQGQNPGLAQTVRLTAGRGQSIRYVALYFAEYSTTGGPQLMFNNLAYTGP